MVNDVYSFLKKIKASGLGFRIEAEAKPDRMQAFIHEYNVTAPSSISSSSDGLVLLEGGADKWGLELRLYVPVAPPSHIAHLFAKNKDYRAAEYSYRMNDNNIIMKLFSCGCVMGYN